MSDESITAITKVETVPGQVTDYGDFRVSHGDKVKVDKLIYNDIEARLGMYIYQDALTKAMFESKYGNEHDYDKCKRSFKTAMKYVAPSDWKVAMQTMIDRALSDNVDRFDDWMDMEDKPEVKAKIMELKRKTVMSLADRMDKAGITSDSGEQVVQLRKLVTVLLQFITQHSDDLDSIELTCNKCGQKMPMGLKDKYITKVMGLKAKLTSEFPVTNLVYDE